MNEDGVFTGGIGHESFKDQAQLGSGDVAFAHVGSVCTAQVDLGGFGGQVRFKIVVKSQSGNGSAGKAQFNLSVKRLIDDEDLRCRQGSNARTLAESRFDRAVSYQEIVRMANRLAK